MFQMQPPKSWVATGESKPNETLIVSYASSTAQAYLTNFEVAIRHVSPKRKLGQGSALNDVDMQVVLAINEDPCWRTVIGAEAGRGARVEFRSSTGIRIKKGSVLTLTVDAGGDGVISMANIHGFIGL